MSQVTTASAQPSPSPARRKRLATLGDMVRSLGLVFLVVLVVLVITPRRWGDPTPQIDYSTDLASARRAAPYPLLAPSGLPDAWDAVSVRYRTTASGATTWHLGFSTPRDQYAGLEQSDGDTAAFVADRTLEGRRMGPARVAGATWQRYEQVHRADPRRSLVRVEGGVATVVTGSASWRELTALASSLRAR